MDISTIALYKLEPCDKFAHMGHLFLLIKPLAPFTRSCSAIRLSGGSAAGEVVTFSVDDRVQPLGALRGN